MSVVPETWTCSCGCGTEGGRSIYSGSLYELVEPRFKHIRRQYGMTVVEVCAQWESQDGQCAICGDYLVFRSPHASKTFHVDHDHRTGEVRGFLCGNCNTGLGRFKDNPDIVQAAATYLAQWRRDGR